MRLRAAAKRQKKKNRTNIERVARSVIYLAVPFFGNCHSRHLPPERSVYEGPVRRASSRPQTALEPSLGERSQPFGHTTILFEQNDGQWPHEVAYRAHTFAETLWVTKDGLLIHSISPSGDVKKSVSEPSAKKNRNDEAAHSPIKHVKRNELINEGDKGYHSWNLIERFLDGMPQIQPFLPGSNPAHVAYFNGNNPQNWRTNILTEKTLNLGEVWNGVHVELHASGEYLEKLFFVAPHTSVATIQMELDGVLSKHTKEHLSTPDQSVYLTQEGGLRVLTGNGEVELSKPLAYQTNENGDRVEIIAEYTVQEKDVESGRTSYGFKVGPYDMNRELVIDPILKSTYIGAKNTVQAMAYSPPPDPNLNGVVYLAATSYTSTFPGASPGSPGGNMQYADILLIKLTSDLGSILGSAYFRGYGDDIPEAVSVDQLGNFFVTGYTDSPNFPATNGAFQIRNWADTNPDASSRIEAIVLGYNFRGGYIVGATYLGGEGVDKGHSIFASPYGIYVTGETSSSRFPLAATPSRDLNDPVDRPDILQGQTDAFVSLMTFDLTGLMKSRYVGGMGSDKGTSIKRTSSGIYIAGETTSPTFPKTSGAPQTQLKKTAGSAIESDAFVSKFGSDLVTITQSSYLGGTGADGASAIAFDTQNNVFVSGFTGSVDFPGILSGTQNQYRGGSRDVFVSKFGNDLKTLTQSLYLGGSAEESSSAIAVTSSGIFIAGQTNSPNLDGSPTITGSVPGGSDDLFLSKLNVDLTYSSLQSSVRGGSGSESVKGMALDEEGFIFLAGNTRSSNFLGNISGVISEFGDQLDNGFLIKVTENLSECTAATEATDCGKTKPQYCSEKTNFSNNLCVSKLKNGDPIPGDPPFGGKCSSSNGASRTCISGVCDPNDDRCGLGLGAGPCTTSNEKVICRSGVCDPNDNRCGLGLGAGPCTTSNEKVICRNGTCGVTGANAGKCVECVDDTACASKTGKASACDLNKNICVQCTQENTKACVGNTPLCDQKTNSCLACTKSYDATAVGTCGFTSPICITSGPKVGSCIKCADHYGSSVEGACYDPAFPICIKKTGICASRCTLDSDCSASQWCDNPSSSANQGVCSPKVPNGDPLPLSAPINGLCSAEVASRVCLGGACDDSENLCGIKNGNPCSGLQASSKCRSYVCYADSACGIPDGVSLSEVAKNNDAAVSVVDPNLACRSGYAEDGVCKSRPDAGDQKPDTSIDSGNKVAESSNKNTSGCSCSTQTRSTSSSLGISAFLTFLFMTFRKRKESPRSS